MAELVDAPPGFWVRAISFPVPVTPLFVDVRLRASIDSRHASSAVLAIPLPERTFRVVDGWVYVGTDGRSALSPERVAAFEANVRDGVERAVHQRWWAELRPAAVAAYRHLQATDPAALSDDALIAHLDRLDTCARDGINAHATNVQAAAVFLGRLGLFCQAHLCLTPADVLALLAGYSRASRAPAAALEAVAEQVSADPTLTAALSSADAATDLHVCALLAPWVKSYGYRATAFDYNVPTLAEQPARVVQLLRDAVVALLADAEDAEARVRRAREAAVAAVRSRLTEAVDRDTFDRLLGDAQAGYEVRDDDAAFVQWGAGLQRRAFLEAGRRFVARGLLADPEQVWYLRWDDVRDSLQAAPAPDLAGRVAEHQAAHERQRAHVPPRSLGTPLPPPTLPPLSDSAQAWLRAASWGREFLGTPPRREEAIAARELRGAAAARGAYRGIARLVRDESEFDRIEPGDVLVCPMTTPTWNVLFSSVGALVTDEGGILSHPAIIAREFGIPAVVGTRHATARIPDGVTVEVDGTTGLVRW